jgi:hypothetical protein
MAEKLMVVPTTADGFSALRALDVGKGVVFTPSRSRRTAVHEYW